MSPISARSYVTDLIGTDAKLGSEFLVQSLLLRVTPDLKNVTICKVRFKMVLTSGDSAFSSAIHNVLELSPQKKMLRVKTPGVVASMQHLKPDRDWSQKKLPEHS